MKFKLIEKFDETRRMIQDYMYDAMDELNNASLEEYIQWFKSELTYYDDVVEQAVKDAYIEACDYGMIKGVEKKRLTSELKEYIESHTDIIDDTDELMRQCPGHLQHELKIVLSKLDESLTEELLTEKLLTEEQVIYRVTHDAYNEGPLYLNVTENKDLKLTDEDARTKLTDLLSKPKQKFRGESVNLNHVGPLSSVYITDPQGLHISREGMFDNVKDVLTPDNMLLLTLSSWRKQAHNDSRVKHIAKSLNLDNYTVHHIDGKEWNNDSSNFLIVPQGNFKDGSDKDFRNFIHTSLHMIKTASAGNKEQKSKSFPLYYIKDDKDVYRMYLTLQLHADKQLTNISLTSDKLN